MKKFQVLWEDAGAVRERSFATLEEATQFRAELEESTSPQVWELKRGRWQTAMHYGRRAQS